MGSARAPESYMWFERHVARDYSLRRKGRQAEDGPLDGA